MLATNTETSTDQETEKLIESTTDDFEAAAAKRFLSRIGKKGAEAGWANRTAEKKAEHIQNMNARRKEKMAKKKLENP